MNAHRSNPPQSLAWFLIAFVLFPHTLPSPPVARRVIKEMDRQVSGLVLDEHGLAKHGLLIRHLVMPRDIAGTRQVMNWIAQELSPTTYVNLMHQYYPAGKVTKQEYAEIDRHVTPAEYEQALQEARRAGLRRQHP